MAGYDSAPYRPQDRQHVAEMLRGLEGNKGFKKGKGGWSCKKHTFDVDGSDIKVDSWRMQDWDYKKPNLPTYARGLFTSKTSKGQPEISVRGYDKFFNEGETTETQWANVQQNTKGPYELSVKENGCIIFIAGLEDETLIVCSKHSTGTRRDLTANHAQVGETWVERHLASVGKTKRDLAVALRAMNATAVAELCDDEFEEHVLAYGPDTAGLYLHGINLNLPEFATYPHHLVDRFAEEWGFKKTTYIMKDDINDVKVFLDKVAEIGNYDGRDTEGFVIRCHSKANTGEWHDWFFKYKFEEPYLMYRQWRECTKAVIAGKAPMYKKHKKITEEYLLFARRQLHADKTLAKAYNDNHGIIKMRDDFLASRGLTGAAIIQQEANDGEVTDGEVTQDVVLVPIATIGCGKTTVSLALCKLFGWGHVQNDNITVRKSKPQAFATACTSALSATPVMIADRNNHQKRERTQLLQDVSHVLPHVRFVALHYVHDHYNFDQIREKLRGRVLKRGDNHQTIHTSMGSEEIISIMEGFMRRFEPIDTQAQPDSRFNLVIDLDPIKSSRDNLETVVTALYNEYPKLFGEKEMPTAQDMDEAIEAALHGYTVGVKHFINVGRDKKSPKPSAGSRQSQQVHPQSGNTSKPKERQVEFFGVKVPSAGIGKILEQTFRNASPDVAKIYKALKSQRRIQTEFHCTLIHRASSPEFPDAWAHLMSLYQQTPAEDNENAPGSPGRKLGMCNVRLERLVWDSRLMAFVVRLSPADTGSGPGEQFSSVNRIAHITVGTMNPDIKPKESNDLLAKWLNEGSGGSTGIYELPLEGMMELEGTVRAILSR